MKIITNKDTVKNSKILSWSDIMVIDGDNIPLIKRVTLNVKAGDIVTLEVEEYGDQNKDVFGGVIQTTFNFSAEGPVTTTRIYCVNSISIDATSTMQIKKQKEINEGQNIERLKTKRLLHLNPINELEL